MLLPRRLSRITLMVADIFAAPAMMLITPFFVMLAARLLLIVATFDEGVAHIPFFDYVSLLRY